MSLHKYTDTNTAIVCTFDTDGLVLSTQHTEQE